MSDEPRTVTAKSMYLFGVSCFLIGMSIGERIKEHAVNKHDVIDTTKTYQTPKATNKSVKAPI